MKNWFNLQNIKNKKYEFVISERNSGRYKASLERISKLENIPLRKIRLHELKILPEYWGKVRTGEKTFEIRKDDRGYKVGDYVIFIVYTQCGSLNYYIPTREVYRITYILRDFDFGLKSDYIAFGIKEIEG